MFVLVSAAKMLICAAFIFKILIKKFRSKGQPVPPHYSNQTKLVSNFCAGLCSKNVNVCRHHF